MKSFRRSKGFSLVEIMLVLGILGILSIAAFIIFRQVKDASDANLESQNITTIIAGVRNLFGARADYVGLDTGIVNGASIFPRAMNSGITTSSQPIFHIAGGEVEVEPWGTGDRMFAVIYRDVPPRLCVKIAQNYGKNVEIVLVDGVAVKEMGDLGTDPSLSATECNRSDLTDISFIQR